MKTSQNRADVLAMTVRRAYTLILRGAPAPGRDVSEALDLLALVADELCAAELSPRTGETVNGYPAGRVEITDAGRAALADESGALDREAASVMSQADGAR